MRQALLLLSLIFAAICVPAYSQTTFATVTGSVVDPSGSAVPGAHVEAVQRESGYVYRAETNTAGVYTLPDLRAGTYD